MASDETRDVPARAFGRVVAFVALVLASLLVAGAYVGWTLAHDRSASSDEPGALSRGGAVVRPSSVLFQHVARDRDYARIAVAGLAGGAGPRLTSGLTCERVHFAAGRGLCLVPKRGSLVQRFEVRIFDTRFAVRDSLTLSGLNSRARVSPDGRYGAVTSFVFGHSYAALGAFSTRTTLIEIESGASLGDLEQFTIIRAGRRITSIDFNFWGVTFARDSNRFYATLRTRGETFLVEGDVRGRRARILYENVECPSLSPDDTRIAFKKRLPDGNGWRLHVLDLATGNETPLAESRSVDDQVEWLDDEQILYGLDASVWSVPADGTGSPRKFLPNALSPAVVRVA